MKKIGPKKGVFNSYLLQYLLINLVFFACIGCANEPRPQSLPSSSAFENSSSSLSNNDDDNESPDDIVSTDSDQQSLSDSSIQPATFSMANTSDKLPSDVMDEVAMWTGGGGVEDIPQDYKFVVSEGIVSLQGFSPNERVRLFLYQSDSDDYVFPTARLIGWQEFFVDSKGNLEIVLDTEARNYSNGLIVVGDKTGEVQQYEHWDLLKESIVASAPRISNFQVCLEPCNGSNKVYELPGGVDIFYIHWIYDNIPVGSSYTRVWKTTQGEWVRYECTWPGPESGIADISLREPGGIKSDLWNVQIIVNGEILLDSYINVNGDWQYWAPAGTFYNC